MSAPASTAKRPLGLFVAAMLMFGITTTLHGLSPLATYGLASLFFLGLSVVTFLIPAGLISAELATGWQREGGVYVWVTEAFGKPFGFLAAWLQWLQNLIFWTVILTGSAAMLAIGFGWEAGAENIAFIAGTVLFAIWFTTFVTARGLRSTGGAGVIGSLVGTILPGIILIGIAVVHLASGGANHLLDDTIANELTRPGSLSYAISTIVIFAGVEVIGSRVTEMRNPERLYPLASLLAISLTVGLLAPVVLAIGVLVPQDQLNIAAGLVQAVTTVFPVNGSFWWIPALFALALLLDSIGEIAGWMAGTPISMAAAGRDGFLPRFLHRREGDTAPGMLYFQAAVGSLISITFLLVPGIQSAFWLLSALLVQLYVLMYALMFAAVLRLRKTQPDQPRPFRVPGGKFGIWLVCIIGLLATAAVFAFGFIRPASLTEIGETHYLVLLGSGLGLSLVVPLALIGFERRCRSRRRSG